MTDYTAIPQLAVYKKHGFWSWIISWPINWKNPPHKFGGHGFDTADAAFTDGKRFLPERKAN